MNRNGAKCADDLGGLSLIAWRPLWTLSWIQCHLLHWGWLVFWLRLFFNLHLQVIYWAVVRTSRNVLWIFGDEPHCELVTWSEWSFTVAPKFSVVLGWQKPLEHNFFKSLEYQEIPNVRKISIVFSREIFFMCIWSCFFSPQHVTGVLGGNWIFGRFEMAHYFTRFRYRLCQFPQFST